MSRYKIGAYRKAKHLHSLVKLLTFVSARFVAQGFRSVGNDHKVCLLYVFYRFY